MSTDFCEEALLIVHEEWKKVGGWTQKAVGREDVWSMELVKGGVQ